jgi:hypothetical protein
MDTRDALFKEFGEPAVPLANVCQRYLGMKYPTARAAANANELPFPVFRLNDSRKAPWMVHIDDLAEHIDSRRKCANESWTASQV